MCVVNVGELCLKIKAFFRLVFFIFYFILYFLIVVVVVVGEQNSTTTKTVNVRKHIFNYVVRAQGFFSIYLYCCCKCCYCCWLLFYLFILAVVVAAIITYYILLLLLVLLLFFTHFCCCWCCCRCWNSVPHLWLPTMRMYAWICVCVCSYILIVPFDSLCIYFLLVAPLPPVSQLVFYIRLCPLSSLQH